MSETRRLPQTFETPELRSVPIGPGERFLMHRFKSEEHALDDPDCWCAPILWTYEETRHMPLRDMQQRLDAFLAVH